MTSFETAIKYIRTKYKDGSLVVEPKTTIMMKILELETFLSEKSILNGLREIEKSNQEITDKEKFIKICKKPESKKESEKHTYQLIIPINYKLTKRKLEYCGRIYKVLSNNTAIRRYGKNEFSDFRNLESRSLRINSFQKYFLETSLKASSSFDAVSQIYNEIESLCGFMNTILDRNKLNVSFGKKTNEATFDIGTIIYSITESSNEYINWSRLTKGLTATRAIKSFEEHEKVNLDIGFKRLKLLDRKSIFTDSLLFNTFTLYYRAKTAIQNENEFMYYWRACENIVLSDDLDGDTVKTLNRVMELTEFFTSYDIDGKVIMNKLSQIRNDFVHRGRIDFDQYYTSIMGSIANSLLFWLIDNRKQFPRKECLLFYLKNRNINNKALQSMLLSLKLIKKDRS